ncbi:MAG: glycosyltransferase [Planctomycetes bacterium]|nr:glycosyltransferase [Planctomycetota bacterium]
MRKLLVLCPYVPFPATHGGSMRSQVLLRALAAEGELHVAAAVVDEAERARLQSMAQQLGVVAHALPARPAVRPWPGAKLGAWLRGRSELLGRRWQAGAAAAVVALRQSVEPALTVLDSSFVLPLVAGSSAPRLLHLHNLEHAALGSLRGGCGARLTTAIERRCMRAAEAAAIAASRCTITVSAGDRERALRLAPQANVVTVPNSIELAAAPLLPPPPPGPPRLLFVGSLDYPPNLAAVHELVREHLPVLRAALPGLVVRLVGRDPHAALAGYRGQQGVEAIGAVDSLAEHYAASHAVYLPIRQGGGTRIKILEAWAFGRPVLSTALGAEGLGEGGRHWRRFETPTEGLAALRDVLGGQAAQLVAAARTLVVAEHGHDAAIVALRQHVRTALS